MTVVRPPDGTLIVRVRPGFIEYALGFALLMPLWTYLPGGTRQLGGALLASAIAGLILSYVAEIADFTFDPVRGELRWVRRTVWKWLTRTGMPVEGSVALRDIRAVEVVSAPGSGESQYNLHRVSLTVPGGVVSFRRYSQTGRASENVARAVLSFLHEHGYHPAARGFDPRAGRERTR